MPPDLPWVIFSSMGALALASWLLRPLVLGLGRRLEGRGADPVVLAELDDVRAQLRELEGVQQRVAELEERVDFAERMLTVGNGEASRVEGGQR